MKIMKAFIDSKDEKTLLIKKLIVIFLSAVFFALGMIYRDLWLGIAFSVICYLLCGTEHLIETGDSIIHFEPFNEDFLMTAATIGAAVLGEWSEAAAVMLLFDIGEWLEDFAVDRSRDNIADLMDLKSDTAHVMRGGELITVDPSEIAVGETIVVKPYEKIPLDGIVADGECRVDLSRLTGESVPVLKKAGDDVLSGSLCTDTPLTVRVTAEYSQSTAAKLIALTEQAQQSRAKSEKFITKFSKIYTPAVVIAAVVVALGAPIVTGSFDFTKWIYVALNFLIISCPCALVISIPLTFAAGIGGASKAGILVKGSDYLETLSRVGTVAFDKTGTLTEGVFEVTEIIPADGFDQDTVLSAAVGAERMSNHPIALSICRSAASINVDSSNQRDIAGQGVTANVGGRNVAVGKPSLMRSLGIDCELPESKGTAAYVAVNGKFAGIIRLGDRIKATSEYAVKALGQMGIKTVMLTGDTLTAAKPIADKIGTDELCAELLPQDKLSIIGEMKSKSDRPVAFAGDGINDAPVLTAAGVGIAMGGMGSAAAVEAADIVLMNDRPSDIALAIRIAKKTMRIVRENVIFSLGIKLVVLVLAAFGYSSMWLAEFADVGVCLLAILNSMRALRISKD